MPRKNAEHEEMHRSLFIIAYLFVILTGVLVLILEGGNDKRLAFHSVQAIMLGLAMIIVAVAARVLAIAIPFMLLLGTTINALIWVYGMYLGLVAYGGKDRSIPTLGRYASEYSHYSA